MERTGQSATCRCGISQHISSWDSNDYRSNGLIGTLWADCHVCSANHAYIVNGKHKPVVEVLLTNNEVG